MASSTFNTTSTSQVYSFFDVYSKEDIELVKRLQEEEQQRRIGDKSGEKQRRDNANSASELFSLNVRPTWFQRGSAYALKVILIARDAGNNILLSSQVQDMNSKINAKLEEVGQKSAAKAQEVKTRAVEAKDDVKGVLQEKLATAQDTAEKVASTTLNKIRGVGKQILRRIKSLGSLTSENITLAFAVMEEENERTYRMNNEQESYAMMNAFKVAGLFKELAPAFYRPEWEPNQHYASKLLEGHERAGRVLSDLNNKTALSRAKSVARLIEHKFAPSAGSDADLDEVKAEVLQEIKEHKPIAAIITTNTTEPLPAGITAAKAEIVNEIKVHRPIPATM